MSDVAKRLAGLSPQKRALLERKIKAAGQEHSREVPRREVGDPCPLSFSQERLWLLDQFDPGNTAYNVYRAVRLTGPLDVPALERSLAEIVRRHESLRTTFPSIDGVPKQIIGEPAAVPLNMMDLSYLPRRDRPAEAVRLATEEACAPFDLSRDLLLRARLVRLGPGEHLLALTSHHIAADGWSVAILFRELGDLYTAYTAGESPRLPEPPIQSADFSLYQRRLSQGPLFEQHVSYWRERLANMPSQLRLPVDHPRPEVLSSRGARHYVHTPPALVESLRLLGHREHASLYMSLLSAFLVLLAHYSGQTDLAVGSPIANRDYPELESLIGCFSNTLVLRADLSGNPSFRQLLGRVREIMLDAFTHHEVGFEKLVTALNPNRETSRMLLVQVNFRLVTAPPAVPRLAGLQSEFLEIDNRGAKFDLAAEFRETPEGLGGFLEYSTDLFEARTMTALEQDFTDLLQLLVAAPDRAWQDLNLVTRLDRKKPVLGRKRATAVTLPWQADRGAS